MSSKQSSRSLPDTWEQNNLESLLTVSIGGIWGDESGLSEVNVDVVRVTELKAHGFIEPNTAAKRSITRKQFQSRALEVGDLLLEKSGGGPNTPVGRVGYVLSIDKPMVCSNFMQLMRPDAKKVLPKYLHFFLTFIHSNGETIAMQTATTNIRNIKTPEYMAFDVPVPSLQEQAKIVEILEEQLLGLDAALASVHAVREKSARFRRSLLHAAFSGALTGHDTSDGKLPKEWEEVEVGKLGHWVTGSTPSSKKPGCFGDSYPFVTPGDIDAWGKLTKTARGLSDIGWKEVRAVSPPSVLLVCIGTIGKVSWSDIEVATNQQINALSVDTDIHEPRFISLLFSSSSFQELLWDNSSSTTVSIINKGTLSKLVVSVPPLGEQKKIVEIVEEQLSRLDASLLIADVVEKKVSALRRSLLHAAFSGKLTREWREGAYV